MSIRKRTWKNASGVEKTAWVVDYVDQGGKRRLKTFERKKDADDFSATAKVEFKAGIHTADSSSITVAEAGERWIMACINAGLERTTTDTYRQHVNLHIVPFLGRRKLSELTIPQVSEVRDETENRDRYREAAFGGYGQACSQRSRRTVVERARERACRPQCRPGDAVKPQARKGTSRRASRQT